MVRALPSHAVSPIALIRPRRTYAWELWVAQAEAAQARRRAEAELRGADTRVKAHEKAHLAAAGPYARGAAQYSYARGPGGEVYAVGGSVQVDLQPVPGDPKATLRKAEAVMRSALSPGSPSAADLRVAAEAYRLAAEAKREIEAGKETSPGQLVNIVA